MPLNWGRGIYVLIIARKVEQMQEVEKKMKMEKNRVRENNRKPIASQLKVTAIYHDECYRRSG